MMLIGLLLKYFIDNLLKFPNHLIHVCKQDISKIRSIMFNYEYSGVTLTSSSAIDISKITNLS